MFIGAREKLEKEKKVVCTAEQRRKVYLFRRLE
jgi:hypothetical protein